MKFHVTNIRTLFLLLVSITLLTVGVSAQSMFDKVNDFDGDGRADFAVLRAEGGLFIWYIWQTTGGYKRIHWGASGDRAAAGDYDGDGKTDAAIARSPQSFNSVTFYFLSSQTGALESRTVNGVNSGYSTPQDFDGDGKADPALHSEVLPLIYRSSATGTQVGVSIPGFLMSIGDLTGDGRAEVTSWQVETGLPEVTINIRNLATGTTTPMRWGIRDDEFVAGDFDGDNKGDITIFRASTGYWWSLRSSDSVVTAVHWGISGDRPVAADYDGDGKSDQAVYRPGSPNGIYYINGSQAGFQAFTWGVPGDFLIRYGDTNGVFLAN